LCHETEWHGLPTEHTFHGRPLVIYNEIIDNQAVLTTRIQRIEMPKILPLRFDYRGALNPQFGITEAQIKALAPRLLAAREEMLTTDMELYANPQSIPDAKQPLDAGFLDMPERLLEGYQADRSNSELGRILRCAATLKDRVDKVVVLGIGGSYMGARAMLECCCQPYFNEYSRAERGGRPRMYFEGNNVDNDWSQQLLHFLRTDSAGKSGPEGKWGIVVISKSGGTLETAAAFRQFLAELERSVGRERLADFVVPVTGQTGKLSNLANSIGCKDRFLVPDGVGGRFSVLSPVGLLPGALLGINVVEMLEGAAAMNSHFRSEPLGRNVVMDFVTVNHLLEVEQGIDIRVLSVWSKSLEAAGLWYDQLLAESLGKSEQGALPLTCVNTRDLHSRAQQHQEGIRDKVMNNVIIDSWRHDPLPVGYSEWDQDQLNELSHKTLADIMSAAIAGTNQAYQDDHRPTTNLHLPAANESALGQFFQMLMLATVLEGRLLEINPYGQPGVEKYKINMNRILRN
jgi:glucose-6-phosphate isomerase